MIILVGKTGSGKTTVAKELERSCGLKRLVTYTSRPMRPGEKDGVDYHFVPESYFKEHADEFAETASYDASFGHCTYGSKKAQYGDPDGLIILNPIGLKAVKAAGVGAMAVYLKVPENVLAERVLARGDDPAEMERRLEADARDFADIGGYADATVEADKMTPDAIAKIISEIASVKGGCHVLL